MSRRSTTPRSAVDGIDFAMASSIAGDKVQQITLVEDDGLKDDLVCSVQNLSHDLASEGYEFSMIRHRSLRTGFERLWAGQLGAVLVTLAILFAVVAFRVMLFG